MAARAMFTPVPDTMSFGDYMNEAYHQMICGSGPRHAIDPAVFAQIKDQLVLMAERKQREDEQKRKTLPDYSSLPPPVPMPAACCFAQTTALVLRRRAQPLVPARLLLL